MTDATTLRESQLQNSKQKDNTKANLNINGVDDGSVENNVANWRDDVKADKKKKKKKNKNKNNNKDLRQTDSEVAQQRIRNGGAYMDSVFDKTQSTVGQADGTNGGEPFSANSL